MPKVQQHSTVKEKENNFEHKVHKKIIYCE